MSPFEELKNMSPTDIEKFKTNLGMNEEQTEAVKLDSEQAPEQLQNNPESAPDSPEQRELLPENIHEEFQKQLAEVAPVTEEVNTLLDHVDGLDNEEPEVTERLNGAMSKITETIKHSKLLKTIITAGAFLAPAVAYGGELNGHLNSMGIGIEDLQSDTNPRDADLNKLAKGPALVHFNLKKLITPSGRIRTSSLDAINQAVRSGKIKPHTKTQEGSLSAVNESIGLSQKAQRESSPTQLGRVHLNPSTSLNHNSLEMNNPANIGNINGVQMNTFRTNTLEKVNHFQKKILPGATVNGSPVYEIAPGIYGNENSQYGNGVHIGTIEINN